MSQFAKTEFVIDHYFDPMRKRHYLNNALTVLHCHHFTTLNTQLALDANETALLQSVAEDSFFPELNAYFDKHAIKSLRDRISIGQQYYAVIGLGKMEVICLGADSGSVELLRSHIDEGWIAKWGTYDKPVNYIGAGFIGALFAASLELPPHSFDVTEVASLVMGAKKSHFKIVRQ